MNLMEEYPWLDYVYFLKMVEDWCDQAQKHYDEDGHLQNHNHVAKELRFVAMLIRRIRTHDYLRPNKVFISRNGSCTIGDGMFFEYTDEYDKNEERDYDLLFSHLRKILPRVWD